MTRDDIIRMAREAGIVVTGEAVWRLCELVAAAEREVLADWMRQHGFSTGKEYTMESLLDRLGTEMVENTDAAVLAEREACAELIEKMNVQHPKYIAAAIRARGE